MRINNNIMAMNTHRQYAINNDNLAKATSRLSSGYRINNAADDAAGLAISEKMRAQIRGLNMAAKNSQDAISLVQTAEGALEETEAILQRMRELAVQSASDTNQEIDRNALDAEFQQLIKEIDDIAKKADFNGTKLLDGSLKAGFTAKASGPVTASVADDTQDVQDFLSFLSGITGLDVGEYTISYTANDGTNPATILFNDGADVYKIEAGTGDTPFTAGDVTIVAVADSRTVATINLSNNAIAELNNVGAAGITLTIANEDDQNAIVNGISFEAGEVPPAQGDYKLTFGDNELTFDGNTDYSAEGITKAGTYDVKDGTGNVVGKVEISAEAFAALGKAGSAVTLSTIDFAIGEDKSVVIQTGSNTGDTLKISIGDMSSKGLKVGTSSIANRADASEAITTVGNAINAVSTQRANLGAMQNRLEHKINNLDTSAENLQSAESRIRDIDMAKEMTQYTQTSILVQAATSMLAQANNAPQNVLSLLR